jgi:hypothetical protein
LTIGGLAHFVLSPVQAGLSQQTGFPEIFVCAGVKRCAKPIEHVLLC